jgi:DNA polymerase III alpha subunit
MRSDYAHLHLHTEYSMLDGAARLKELFAEVDRLGMTAVGITDHGNMHRAYDFFTQAKVERLKEIIQRHPGDAEVPVKLTDGSRTTAYRLGFQFRAAASPTLSADLKALVGAAAVAM